MTRDEALALVRAHITRGNLVKHMLATEAVMRALAERFGEDPDLWGLAGLLHDLDYELTVDDRDRHGAVTGELLAGRAMDPLLLHAIRVHLRGERISRMDTALHAADQLTGLIVAAALIHPSKRLESIDAEFVLHRLNEARFARGTNRQAIRSCTEIELGVEEFVQLGLEAMRGIGAELGL